MPESGISNGELAAVDTTASIPLAEPGAEGEKVRVKVTLWFEESVIGKLSPLREKPAPLTVAAEIVTASALALVKDSVRLELLPFCTLPKESGDDDADRVAPALDALGAKPWHPMSSGSPAAMTRAPIGKRWNREARTGQFLRAF